MSNATAERAGTPTIEQRHRMEIALEWAGISKQAMADHLDIARHTVTNYLSGRTTPTRATLIAWALRCGVPLSWIEHGDDPNGDGRDSDAVTLGYEELDDSNVIEFARDRYLVAA